MFSDCDHYRVVYSSVAFVTRLSFPRSVRFIIHRVLEKIDLLFIYEGPAALSSVAGRWPVSLWTRDKQPFCSVSPKRLLRIDFSKKCLRNDGVGCSFVGG